MSINRYNPWRSFRVIFDFLKHQLSKYSAQVTNLRAERFEAECSERSGNIKRRAKLCKFAEKIFKV